MYFEDLVGGKDVSRYGNEKETPYSSPKRKLKDRTIMYNTVQGSLNKLIN